MKLVVAHGTHSGRQREINEDAIGVFGVTESWLRGARTPLLIVADGMGGYKGGEVASQLAIKTIRSAFYDTIQQRNPPEALRHAIQEANNQVRRRSAQDRSLSGMGTTVVAATLAHDRLHVANVGDSRAYLVRGEEIRQLTDDHSAAAEQERRGEIVSGKRNAITRAVGRRANLAVDTFTYQWKSGDVLLLCSDGLWGQVSDAQIAAVVAELVPSEAVSKLIEMTLIAQAPDNISVIVASGVE